MNRKLQYKCVTPLLLDILKELMVAPPFQAFRLVGGTALSLYRGHRMSVDIDLFTDSEYGSINFDEIDRFLKQNFAYVETSNWGPVGMGKPYFVGTDKNNCVKLDLFYTDPFIREVQLIDGIRLTAEEEIVAMKIDVISRTGRKKDFWDIHEILDDYPLTKLLSLHKERYPYNHDELLILRQMLNFSYADDDFNPVCLKDKYWELVKLDISSVVRGTI